MPRLAEAWIEMAKKYKDATPDAETPPKSGERKKLLMLGTGLLGLIILSVVLTTVIFSSMQPEAPEPTQAAEVASQTVDPAAAKAIAELKAQLERQAAAIAQLEGELAALRESSSLRQLHKILASQERSFQAFLVAMKEGMSDISNMVRGSRTWLEHYEGRLDEVIVQSQTRIDALTQGTEGAVAPLEQP